MSRGWRVTAVVPVKDEREAIGSLLDRFERAFAASHEYAWRLIVVDGASTDGTPEIVRDRARRLPIELLALTESRGLGGALRAGLEAALPESDVVVTMDGDGTHDPCDMGLLLAALAEGPDFVVASRFAPGGDEIGVPGHRKVLSHVASALLRTLYPVDGVQDYSSGYRAYRAEALREVERRRGALVRETGFSCMLELLLELRDCGAWGAEVPLVLRYDLKPGESKMNVGHTIARYLGLMARHRRTALRRPRGSRDALQVGG